jgi:hypothetical protein
MYSVFLTNNRVLIGPIDIPGNTSVDASEFVNPGIGGSEMHSIVLANALSKNFEVTLWARSGPFPQGKFKVVRKPAKFSDYDLQIAYTSNAQSESFELLPLIAISHHPFDGHIKSLPTRTVAIANVGRFQLLSNARKSKARGIAQIWLPVILREPPTFHPPSLQSERIVAGHISSLHPSKGFLHVLKGWTKFRVKDKSESQLRVLGGISLYGAEESHPTLPTELHFGNKLSREIKGNDTQSIVFLGRLSGDIANEIAKWDIAILNPKGWGESESVSMKDCWRMGVPVIAGNRFGQRDYMNDFPELQASSPRQIARLLKRYQRGKISRVDLSNRAMERYSILEQRGRLSEQKWAELVTVVTEKHPTGLANCGIPIGKIRNSQRIAVWIDHFRITVHLTLIGGLSMIRALLK